MDRILLVPLLPHAIQPAKMIPPLAQAKRTGGGVGSAFDGSDGVDSQDILSIPDIGFGSFQLFPDQNSYATVPGPLTPPSASFNSTVQEGTVWIQTQAAAALA